MLCPNGHEVTSDASFCPTCGAARVEPTQRCPNGHEVSADAHFCPSCGASISEMQSVSSATEHAGQDARGDDGDASLDARRTLKRPLLIGLGVPEFRSS